MESWEISYINKNLSELYKCTDVNESLLAILVGTEILGTHETSELRRIDARIDRAARFYEILTTRTNSYNLLIDALKDTKQSGAVKILVKGKSRCRSNSVGLVYETVEARLKCMIEMTSKACTVQELVEILLESVKQLIRGQIPEHINPEMLNGLMEDLESSCLKNVKVAVLEDVDRLLSQKLEQVETKANSILIGIPMAPSMEVLLSQVRLNDFYQSISGNLSNKFAKECSSLFTMQALKAHANKHFKEKCDAILNQNFFEITKKSFCELCTNKPLRGRIEELYMDNMKKRKGFQKVYDVAAISELHKSTLSCVAAHLHNEIKSNSSLCFNIVERWCNPNFEELKTDWLIDVKTDCTVVLIVDFGANTTKSVLVYDDHIIEDTIMQVSGERIMNEFDKRYSQEVFNIKQKLGCTNLDLTSISCSGLDGRDILAKIFNYLRVLLQSHVTFLITQVVFVVPCWWEYQQIQYITESAEKADLAVGAIISDTDALLSTCIKGGFSGLRNTTFIIISIGTTTCSVAIVEKDKVISHRGNSVIGANSLLHNLAKFCWKEFGKRNNYFDMELWILTEVGQKMLHRLKAECIKFIHDNDAGKRDVNVYVESFRDDLELDVNVSATGFNTYVSKLCDKTFCIVNEALEQASLNADDIGNVVLAGRCSQQRRVKEKLVSYFPNVNIPNVTVLTDEFSVVRGAAHYYIDHKASCSDDQ